MLYLLSAIPLNFTYCFIGKYLHKDKIHQRNEFVYEIVKFYVALGFL